MWYDVNQTLTHNALINIIIGPRGYGKTFSLKCKALRDYIKKGRQFIYLRRYQTELDLVKDNLFDDLITEGVMDGEMKCKGDVYLYNDELCGYAIALNTANYYKSASFPFVDLIIYDEFIIDTTQSSHYLKGEVDKLLNFIETVGRMRDNIKVFLLANSLSFVNPYTLYWNIKKPENEKRIVKAVDNLVLLQLVGDDEFKERKKDTVFGRLNAGTEFERMSIDNQFILDSEVFVEKKPGDAKYTFTLEYGLVKLGIWYDHSTRLFYIDEDVDPSCMLSYAVLMEDHSPNTRLLKHSDRGAFASLIKAFKSGNARFSSIKVKWAMMEVFKLTL